MSGKSGARRKDSTPAWVVLKFGGTSVSSVGALGRPSPRLVRQRQAEGLRPVVVHSALATVSNRLDELLHRALEMDVTAQVAGIRELHLRLAADLQVDGEKELGGYFRELEQLLAGIHLIREVSPRIQARVMGLGELMATRLGAAYLAASGPDGDLARCPRVAAQ